MPPSNLGIVFGPNLLRQRSVLSCDQGIKLKSNGVGGGEIFFSLFGLLQQCSNCWYFVKDSLKYSVVVVVLVGKWWLL